MKTVMRAVIIETPYAGDVDKNVRYARACLRDSIRLGEAPFASHLLYTQEGILDDGEPAQRTRGIECGLAIGSRLDATVVYTDLGVSDGMRIGIKHALDSNRELEFRTLGGEWKK